MKPMEQFIQQMLASAQQVRSGDAGGATETIQRALRQAGLLAPDSAPAVPAAPDTPEFIDINPLPGAARTPPPRKSARVRPKAPDWKRAPLAKLRVASHVLDAIGRDRVSACVPPREARWALFRAAATRTSGREQVLGEVAASLGVSADALEAALFADLDGEKRVAALPGELTPQGFLPIANQAIVRSLLRRALRVRVCAFTDAGSLIQRARELGLICGVEPLARELLEGNGDAAILRISGPFTLFRRTEVYARALAALLPALTRCERFELEVSCVMGPRQRPLRLSVSSSDPIGLAQEPSTSASRVRERFVRDFRKAAPHWELKVVSPGVRRDGAITLADFELVHRSEPAGDVAKESESSADEPRANFAKPARGLAQVPKHVADMAAVAPFLLFNLPNAPAIFNI